MFPAAVDQALGLPPDEAVKHLLELPESQWFERKSGIIKPVDLAVPLIAMANSEGGVVVAGLSDGKIVPISDKADNDLRQAAIDFTVPTVRVRVEELLTSQGRILAFRVGPDDHVHESKKGECFQRVGDESRRLTFAQRQELEWDRGVTRFDGTAVPSTDITDLSAAQLAAYQQALGSASPELTLRARDLLTRDNEITVAAYLLFADRPQIIYPSAHVRVLKYADIERGSGRTHTLEEGTDTRCEGSIPQQITQAMHVIQELLPRRQALGDSGRFEGVPMIPTDAWLEGLVNAVVHRSYSIGGDHIRVEIFPNRIEITSPGRFPGMANPAHPESINRYARNPRIARVCADLGITQELGEGIRRIFSEMRRVGLADPMYVQTTETVRLTLLASNAVPEAIMTSLGAGAIRVLDALRLAQRPLGTGQITELVDLARPTVLRHLNALRDAGLVVWEGDSPKDPRAAWRVG